MDLFRINNNRIISEQKEIKLICTHSKYGNFTKGKEYLAIAFAKQGRQFTNFKIEDDDGDLYSIEGKFFNEKGPLLFDVVELKIDERYNDER